jgi:hypothetical protein
VGLPLSLYAEWRQSVEELLREQFLVNLDRHSPESAVHVHAESAGALASLEEAISSPRERHTRSGAVAGDPTTKDVELRLSEEGGNQFLTLDRTLGEASDQAGDPASIPAARPEVRALGRWICDQVRNQATGAIPTRWHGHPSRG